MNRSTYNLFPIPPDTQEHVLKVFADLSDEVLGPAEQLHVNNLGKANPTRYLFELGLRPDVLQYGDWGVEAYRAGVFIGGVLMRSVLRQNNIDPSVYCMPGAVTTVEMRGRMEEYQRLAETSRFILQQFFETSEDPKVGVGVAIARQRTESLEFDEHVTEKAALAIIGLGDTLALHAALHGESFESVEPVVQLEDIVSH